MGIEEILLGESKNVEFKVQRPERSIKYMKSVVAFANGKGGRIIFGVDDKTKEVVGIPEDKVFQEIDAITNAIFDSCEPTIIPDVYLQNINQKTVIVVEISAGRQKPYYIKADGLEDGVYIRVSGTTRPADRDMSRELYYECGVFKGETRAVFVDKRDYGGPLWEQVENTVKFVLRNIHLGCRLEGVYRQDIYELPPDSIRELVVNAVMNCSYLQASHIQVAIYDDRLEITSPGGLLPGVTVDLMKEGFSKIRNRSLANAFAYMNLVEAWGSGIPKLIKAMKAYELRAPEFIDMEVAFRINLYRGQIEVIDTKNDTNDIKNDTKVDLETRLVELIRRDSRITQKAMGKELSVSTITIKRTLAQMKQEGKIVREGSNRMGKWILIDRK